MNGIHPRLALSIRQPWAWLIVMGHKTIENRGWMTSFRGPAFIHAAKGMTEDEYEACRAFALKIDPAIPFPMARHLERGGIVGLAEVTDSVRNHPSPWFVGPVGFVLARPRPLPFERCRGELGFFNPERERGLL